MGLNIIIVFTNNGTIFLNISYSELQQKPACHDGFNKSTFVVIIDPPVGYNIVQVVIQLCLPTRLYIVPMDPTFHDGL